MNNAVSKGWGLGTDSEEDGTNTLERGDFVDVMNIGGFEMGTPPAPRARGCPPVNLYGRAGIIADRCEGTTGYIRAAAGHGKAG